MWKLALNDAAVSPLGSSDEITVLQRQVYLVYRDGEAMQEHPLPFMRPYHQLVAVTVDYDDGDMGAGPRERSFPLRFAEDRPGLRDRPRVV